MFLFVLIHHSRSNLLSEPCFGVNSKTASLLFHLPKHSHSLLLFVLPLAMLSLWHYNSIFDSSALSNRKELILSAPKVSFIIVFFERGVSFACKKQQKVP